MKLLKIKWDEIDTMCEELALAIQQSGYKPDVIVGIARGGWVPARLLSDKMGNETVASMRVEFYTMPGVTKKTPTITQPVSVDVHGKHVLLVDDVSDTGHSLEVAFKSLSDAKEVRTATLHYKPHSIFKPDYFVGTTSEWIVYPWEVGETEKKLKEKSGQ